MAAQAAGGPLARARANVGALRTLRALQESGAAPTAEQARSLAAYSGWGGAADAFKEDYLPDERSWAQVNAALRELLGDDEYAEARASTLTAFYTPPSVAEGVHDVLASLGFGAGREGAADADYALEPGCGTGNFMGAGEARGRAYSYVGIEIDRVTAQIAQALHPGDTIVNASLDECFVSHGAFDVVMGNVPYSDAIKLESPDGRKVPIHDYFIMESVEALRPGGVAALLTSRYTMDKQSDATRRWIASRAELIGAARLPVETFRAQAGTDVVSDVLLLKKRSEPIASPEGCEWVRTTALPAPDGSTVPVNALFADGSHVVGELSLALGRHGYGVEVRSGLDPAQIGPMMASDLLDQVGGLGDLREGLGKRAEHPIAAVRPSAARNLFEFFADEGGGLWYGDGEMVEAVPLPAADHARMLGMVRLRDAARELMAFERSCADERQVAGRIAELDRQYDDFVERHGQLGDARNKRLWARCGVDYSYQNVLSPIENRDSRGRLIGKGDILTRRVQGSVAPAPEHIGDARDALAYSLDRTGGVDMGLICSLTGLDAEGCAEELADSVVIDPQSGRALLADEYLSGDVVAKIDQVDRALDDLTEAPRRDRRQAWLESRGIAEVERAMAARADRGLREKVNDRGGAWTAFCDPLSSTTAVDVEAACAAAGIPRWRALAPGQAIALLDDLRPGCVLMRDDEAAGLWNAACGSLQANRDEGATTAVYLLRRAALAGTDVVSDEALMHMVARGRVLADAPIAALLRDVVPDGVEMPTQDDASEFLHARPGEAAGAGRLRALAEALRSDPDILDYALMAAHRADLRHIEDMRRDRFANPYAVMRRGGIESTREEFLRFKREREAFEAAHPVEPDASKVAELRRLRERLEAAAPARLAPEEISVSLGAPWIPASVYYEFAAETFKFEEAHRLAGSSDAAASRWQVMRSPRTGAWQVKYGGAPELAPQVANAYGTADANPLYLMESAMNGSSISITKPDPDPPADRPGARVKDPVATAAAYRMRDKINDEFKRWAMADPARAELLAGIYNRKFNNLAPRRYDGAYLSLPGISPGIELRAHQKDAVARVLQGDEGSLIAHVVGAGKTYACVASIMESRRIGKASKPLVVVPNHLTEQWASEFLELYPDARVLFMTSQDTRNQDATRAFWGRAAAGDWDAVIVGQSRFDMLRLSTEQRLKAFGARREEILASIAEAHADGNTFGVKQLEAARKRVERTLKTLREGGSRETEGAVFENIGFDMLVVDEAHYYKNLAVVGRSVAGMSSTTSAKCENLVDICDYLREQGKGSNIVFATGTPVSNTMSELYNMQRYLAPGLLRSQGVYHFSDWAQTFGQTVQSVEVKPESNGFQVKERFARFNNLPELMAGFHTFSDIMTQDDLDLDVPEVEVEVVAVEADDEQRELVERLAERAELIRQGGVDPAEDNLLKITSEGRALALSPRILDGIRDSEAEYGSEGGKLKACAENIARVWSDTAADLGTQLVFCDASTPSRDAWNVYGEIKAQLIGLGIPESQIAFVHDYTTPKSRDALFEQVNAGEVRVLFGSTQKLGTGTNVQARLAAIHDVDCPWRPSDLEQRLGRVQRQGNMFGKVKDFRYVTTGTFDSYLYQTVERKQRFIAQVFTNKCPARSGDDLDETVLDYATIKAVASGDPAVRDRLMKENRLQELEMQRQAHAKLIAGTRDDILNRHRPTVEYLTDRVARLRDDHDLFSSAKNMLERDKAAAAPYPVVVRGETFSSNQDTAKAILAFRAACRAPGLHEFGSAYGARLGLMLDRELNAHLCAIGRHEHEYERPLSLQTIGPETCLRQMERLFDSVADGLEQNEERLEAAIAKLRQAESELEVGWDQQEEYDRIKAELAAEDVTGNHPKAVAEGPKEPMGDEGKKDVTMEETTELELWFREYDALAEAAARRDAACWGDQVRLGGPLFASPAALERANSMTERECPTADPVSTWIAMSNRVGAEEIARHSDDGEWLARAAWLSGDGKGADVCRMEIGPGAFAREWHDRALHDRPDLYADMTGDQIVELAGVIGAENARAIPAVLDWFDDAEAELISISHEGVGSEWGWNYDVTGNGDWVSEGDFAKVLETDQERDMFLIIANGELGLDALEAMRDDPVRLADLASDAVENPGYVYGTERELIDLDFFSAIELAEHRPHMLVPLADPAVAGDCDKVWERDLWHDTPYEESRKVTMWTGSPAGDVQEKAVLSLAAPWAKAQPLQPLGEPASREVLESMIAAVEDSEMIVLDICRDVSPGVSEVKERIEFWTDEADRWAINTTLDAPGATAHEVDGDLVIQSRDGESVYLSVVRRLDRSVAPMGESPWDCLEAWDGASKVGLTREIGQAHDAATEEMRGRRAEF